MIQAEKEFDKAKVAYIEAKKNAEAMDLTKLGAKKEAEDKQLAKDKIAQTNAKAAWDAAIKKAKADLGGATDIAAL